jgi:hypothetical protein
MAEATANKLFRCPVKVLPGPGYSGPANWLGAFVECFVAAPDYLNALRMAAGKLAEEGWQFDDLLDGKVDQLDPQKWDEHVASVWPELRGHLLPQADILRLVQAGGVYFGPFCGWESEAE